MNILVTGGGGFLGRHIIKMLIERGHNVESFSRTTHPILDRLSIRSIKGDLQHYNQVVKACQGKEAIFHVASKVGMWGEWQDFYNTNVQGTENILNAAKECGIKYLVYTSTPSVIFDKRSIHAGDESLPYCKNPLNYYQKSKILAEKMVLSQKEIRTLAIRPHLIFGEDDPHLIPRLMQKAQLGKLIKIGNGQNKVDVTYVENAAFAHILALEKLITHDKVCGKAYFIGNEHPVNLWDFINLILSFSRIKTVEKSIPLTMGYLLGKVLETIYWLFKIKKEPPLTSFIALQMGTSHYFNHQAAKNDLGYFPLVSLYQSMERLKKLFSSKL